MGNVAIGTATLAPAGMLPELARAFSVSIASAGQLIWLGAIVIGVGAPLLAWAASRVDRHLLLIVSLLGLALGCVGSALLPRFDGQLGMRLFIVIAAALYTPQAAAAVGLLVPGARRAESVAFVFLGWSLASAAGIPFASYVGTRWGWQTVYGIIAAMALVQALVIWRAVPAKLFAPAVSWQTWLSVLRNRRLLLLLAVTCLQMAGQFVLFSYLAPEFKRRAAPSPELLAGLLALYGVFGVIGNVIVTRSVGRVGPARAVLLALCLVIGGLAFWSVPGGTLWLLVPGLVCWGLGAFATNSLQQGRLIASAPAAAPATVALNTSALYLGWAIGGAAGGALLTAGKADALAPVAVAFVLVALVVSVWAERQGRLG